MALYPYVGLRRLRRVLAMSGICPACRKVGHVPADCRDFRIQPHGCPCQHWKVVPRDDPPIEGPGGDSEAA